MGTDLHRRGFLGGAVGLGGALGLGGLSGAALLSACGDDDGGEGGDGPLSLGLIPITDVAPVYLARERGTFADHGIEVEPQFAEGGAVILPSVVSGEYDVGFSNIVSLLLLQAQGESFTIVAGGGLTATGDEPDYSQLIVLEDSPLEGVADLEGRTVAINTLGNALEIVLRRSMDMAGGDHESIDFREIAFPDMRAALEAGEVDAIQYNEPFQTMLQQDGGVRTIGQPFVDAAPGEVLAFYFVRQRDRDAELAVGFRDAMAEINAFAAENEDEVRAILPEYLEGMTPELAQELVMPPYVEDSIRRSSVEIYAELMTEYGLVDEVPDVDALLP